MPDERSDYYSGWDKKAKAMAEEVDAEEKAAPKNAAEGPTIAKASEERKDHSKLSEERAQLIKDLEDRFVTIKRPDECAGTAGKAVKIVGATAGRFELPDRVTKVFVENCTDVVVVVGDVVTKTAELHRCKNVRVEYETMGTIQVDECAGCALACSGGREQVGDVYAAHSQLGISAEGQELGSVDAAAQLVCRATPGGLHTERVGRLENEFPSTLTAAKGTGPGQEQVLAPGAEAAKFKAQGNEAFRANDFMQAAALYTRAADLDAAESGALLNRAQCWLKLGDPAKALADAEACLARDPSLVKAHFRKGMSLHALERYGDAIQAFCKAEDLDPKNKQVTDAIKMAQLMARKQAQAP